MIMDFALLIKFGIGLTTRRVDASSLNFSSLYFFGETPEKISKHAP
jgi:hypothetical protein